MKIDIFVVNIEATFDDLSIVLSCERFHYWKLG